MSVLQSVSLKEDEGTDGTESSSLLGVSDTFGLEGLNLWGCSRTVHCRMIVQP